MDVYQVEAGQVGLTLAIVLNKRDLDRILGHNPLKIEMGLLRIHISFCEPPRLASFDMNNKTYFISLGFKEVRSLKEEEPVGATNMIEGVRFKLAILLEKDR